MITRRHVCGALILSGLPVGVVARQSSIEGRLDALEARHGGRLGVAMVDLGSGRAIAHRGHERFPMCSTVKLPTVAHVLARVDRGRERLNRLVTYRRADLVDYSPITEKHLTDGMTVAALCEAAITLSDNTAQNLLLDSFGGPAALTAYLKSLGDRTTRADRREPELNTVAPGDPRDTASPLSMLRLMRLTLAGGALSRPSCKQLVAWMRATTTGEKRLRAGAPTNWRAGDKTGTGPRNATNDLAIFHAPGRAPILVAAFFIDSPAPLAHREAVLADVGRLAQMV